MKLLIADDELQIRLGLAESVDWAQLGIEAVLTAEDGLEALEVCQRERPEIVITDIRMPGLDGLELGKRLVRLYQPVRVIILSGYSEFSYAREAVQLGAADYLLKPVQLEELEARVKVAVDSVREQLRDSGDLGAYRMRQCQRQVEAWLAAGGEAAAAALAQLDGRGADARRVLGVAAYDRLPQGGARDVQPVLIQMAALLRALDASVLFESDAGFAFCCDADAPALDVLTKGVIGVNAQLMSQLHVTVSVAVSGACPPDELPIRYRACQQALVHRLYLGPCQVLDAALYRQVQPVGYIPYDEAGLRDQIRVFSYEGASERMKRLFERLKSERVGDVDAVRALCVHLKGLLYQVLSDKGIDMEPLLSENPTMFQEPDHYALMDDYQAWCDTLYYLVLKGLSQLTARGASRCVVQAVDYIARNLGTAQLSLESVADAVGKSKNYFSLLFKSEMGMTFVDYLSRARVERAAQLLTTTDLLTYEIAEKAGFSDYKYFSTVFKKHTGQSPMAYRKRRS